LAISWRRSLGYAVKLASTAAIAALLKSSSIALLWLGIAGGPVRPET
jgi:hypothetical protein